MSSKKVKAVDKQPEKVMTKYDRKVQKRKEEEKRERITKKITSISAIVILAAVVVGTSIGLWLRYDSIYNKYIVIGDESVNEIEFDYYYNTSVNNFVSTYSSYLSYFGLDTTKDFADQEYSTDLSWYDYFAKSAVEQMTQSKQLVADADEKSFEYDVTDDYNNFTSQLSDAASEAGLSVKAYYKQAFGSHATESNLKTTIQEYLKASAYYDKLSEDLAATDAEIADTYKADSASYDYFDYRIFNVKAETANDTAAMAAAKTTADTMLGNVKDEETFAEQCLVNSTTDSDKTTYADTAASLKSKTRSSAMTTAVKEWLTDETRQAGDKTVIEDTSNSTYYVVYFVNRYFDETINDEIAQAVLSDKLTSYVEGLTADIGITDKHKHLKYLTVEE